MGFGFLFLGYLFMFSFPYKTLDVFPDLIGFVISFIGIFKLSKYGYSFDRVKKYLYILIPASLLELILQILGLTQNDVSLYTGIFNPVYSALILVYNILLLISIRNIALGTDMLSIGAKALRNIYIAIIYYGINIVLSFPIGYIQELKLALESRYFAVTMLVFGYIWLILNIALIFNCYMYICDENDVEMLTKKEKKEKEGDK